MVKYLTGKIKICNQRELIMSIGDVSMEPQGEFLIGQVTVESIGFVPSRVWNPSPSQRHRTEPYDLPMTIRIAIEEIYYFK